MDANGTSRVFQVNDGNVNIDKSVEFSGLQITGGYTNNSGGGIYNTENLEILNSSITNNFANGDPYRSGGGGGIYSKFGSLAVSHSNISQNTSNGAGGGGILIDKGNFILERV